MDIKEAVWQPTGDAYHELVDVLGPFRDGICLDTDRSIINAGMADNDLIEDYREMNLCDGMWRCGTMFLTEAMQSQKDNDDEDDQIIKELSEDKGFNTHTVKEKMVTHGPYVFGEKNLIHLHPSLPYRDVIDGLTKAFDCKVQHTGAFWYPPGGYMGWHTNENNMGHRLYAVYVPESNMSYFKYRDPKDGSIITDWDQKGWNIRVFKILRGKDRLWHCVYSGTDRISLGFNLVG